MKHITSFLLFLFFCCVVSGCSVFVPHKDTTIFYTLSDHSAINDGKDTMTSGDKCLISLFIGEIPSYADCPHIVQKVHNNRLILSDKSRWAEPMQHMCARVIKDKLSNLLLGRAQILSAACVDFSAIPCDYRLSIYIDDLIYNDDIKCVLLRCTFVLFDYRKNKQIRIENYVNSITVDNPTEDTIVDGMRKCLGNTAYVIFNEIDAILSDNSKNSN